MNILNCLWRPIKKFSKGVIALLGLNLLLITCSFIFDSCTRENDYRENRDFKIEESLISFKAAMEKAVEKAKKSTTASRSATPISDDEVPGPDEPPTPDSPGDDTDREEYALYIVSRTEAAALQLIHSYGITDAELLDELGIELGGKVSAGVLTLIAQSILETENMIDKGWTLSILDNESDYSYAYFQIPGVNFAMAQSEKSVSQCLGEVILPVAGIVKLAEKGIKGLGKKGAMKLIRKIASRALGPVGAALAVYDFGDCMDWW